MATALELAGGDPSRDLPPDQKDGDSLLPTLLGRPQAQKAAEEDAPSSLVASDPWLECV